MNTRYQVFEFSVEARQVQEVVASIFHTILFHRTLGKCNFKNEGNSYTVSTLDFEDVACDFVDFTYVRCASDDMNRYVTSEINSFCAALRSQEGPYSGQISLEFYQKKRGRWAAVFTQEFSSWEVWTLKVNVICLPNEHERQIYRKKIRDLLAEKVFDIVSAMNKYDYVPKIPGQADIDLYFDTSYSDVQPYLFRINHETSGPTNPSVGTAVRRLIKDTLAL
ncbi:autophagy-related protein 101 isoform X1 [Parasteatoda tepidariorum]|uniref:autophagy-related protein 101 isoform X1 n=1 Tax=Parasteatoda tepidariorum TaxID=114398 RepID=UPI00077F949C|nr:autophagy-related protein 101 isoform X1 [Parasteatoda tepidariorum]